MEPNYTSAPVTTNHATAIEENPLFFKAIFLT